MRLSRRQLLVTAASAAAAASPELASAKALWPGARYTRAQRDRAIRRGLRFIYRLARVRRHFDDYGDDFLWCFYSLSTAAADPWLKRTAWELGLERARQWRRDHPRVPSDADADTVAALVSGSYSAERFGVGDDAMHAALARAARQFSAVDFLRFDPASGIIPDNVRDSCGDDAPKNSTSDDCSDSGEIISPYELLLDALVTTYTGDHYGVRLGASLAEVTALVPRMRPYRVDESANAGFIDVTYAITHIVYVLNDYGKYRLRPDWLPHEFAFLKTHLRRSIGDDDAETTGEFLDSLKAFGVTEQDPLIQEGMAFVLARQHADGSWGERDGEDPYTPYHSTWTAISGLMDYAWAGEAVSFPDALERLRGAGRAA
jgi:hypothetical protein